MYCCLLSHEVVFIVKMRRVANTSLLKALGGPVRGMSGVEVGWASKHLAQSREPLLFTPGPLTTSAAVKKAMLVDTG